MNINWILNDDGGNYHFRLNPGDHSNIIITVGDPDRVVKIANYLDRIETNVQSRASKTVTGYISGKRVSVMSTGIGTANIDIVMNGVDALFQPRFQLIVSNSKKKSLCFIRLGTSSAIQEDIPIDSLLATKWSFGMDGLLPFYTNENNCIDLPGSLVQELPVISKCFVFHADEKLFKHFQSEEIIIGTTLTASGFYAPQGRTTRINKFDLLSKMQNWNVEKIGRITNLEMETPAIYGLSSLMGHKALSIGAILANRITGYFSKKPEKTIVKLI